MTDVVESNRKLHASWHELNDAWLAACESGDAAAAERLRVRRDAVGTEFVNQNLPFAAKVAWKWARVNMSNRDDYMAAAYEKLWAAFLSWDPEKGTFSTWAKAHIEGGVRREVSRQEFNGRSYDDFNARPMVAAAKERLAEELGHAPSMEELRAATGIPTDAVDSLAAAVRRLEDAGVSVSAEALAQESGVGARVTSRYLRSVEQLAEKLGRAPTAEEVSADTGMSRAALERALAPRPKRLDAPASADGKMTVGDRLADRLADVSQVGDEDEWAGRLAELCGPLSGQQIWTLIRIEGLDGADPQKIRDVAAQIDVGRETVRRAEDTALKLASAAADELFDGT